MYERDARDERRISKFMDQERVVELTHVAPIPEFGQLLENLHVILRRTGRYLYWLAHTGPGLRLLREGNLPLTRPRSQ